MCEYLVERLRPGTEVVSRTMTDKKNLIDKCGEAAALLLHEDCQRVIIIWDLHPPWRLENPKGKEPCRHEEREGIIKSLEEAGVMSPDVHLICICEELEAWLLADKRAIEAAIEKLIRRRPKIRGVRRDTESVKKPKVRLDKIFKQHTHRPYQGHVHAIKIVRELPDLNKIKRSQSFTRFALKATNTEL